SGLKSRQTHSVTESTDPRGARGTCKASADRRQRRRGPARPLPALAQKPADAQWETRRKKVNDWVANTLMSRLDNKEKGAAVQRQFGMLCDKAQRETGAP